jgi:hypothetical protein
MGGYLLYLPRQTIALPALRTSKSVGKYLEFSLVTWA